MKTRYRFARSGRRIIEFVGDVVTGLGGTARAVPDAARFNFVESILQILQG